ncbi:MAG: hypothetical protein A2Y94_13795 [Caldithrix sp. RBG_13_44_9]|nr:MAG: hypothetical protein A2Y94_13795 [Caldithrix sp. RBG_13_44_9]
MFVDIRSFWIGIKLMGEKRFHFWDPKYWRVIFHKLFEIHPSGHRLPDFWIHLWTPKWHKNRGPYISIGIGFIAIHRGY